MTIHFGEYRLLPLERELWGPSGEIELGDRSFDILQALLERANHVVSKNDLLDAVWPGVAVEENTLQVHVSALRKALEPSLIRTVHGRGYKYAGPAPSQSSLHEETRDAVRRAPAAPGGERKTTSVAVLPFASDADQAHGEPLAEGVAEDLIIELARYRHLDVLGHRITTGYDSTASPIDAGRELGVEFIVDGRIRRSGDAVRVTVRLTDTDSGAHVWGDRFDRKLGDIFAVQDEIVAAVVARLAFNLDEAAERQRSRDPTSSGGAYVEFLRARTHWRNGEPRRALECATKAIEIDPGYARAHAYVAYFLAFGLFGQWYDLAEQELIERSRREMELALAKDRFDPFILQRAAMTYLMLGEPHRAIRFAETAALESARDSEILVIHGLTLACCGDRETSVPMLERAVALEPRLSPGCYSALSEARHMMRDYAGSQTALEKVPDPPIYFRLLSAANLARLGRGEEAKAIVREIGATFDCELFSRREAKLCALPEDVEHWLESFRLAGVNV